MQTRPGPARFLLDNLGWLLGSLAIAVVIWYAAVSAQNPVEQRRFPTRLPIQLLKDDTLLVVNNPPESALVTVRAPRSMWDIMEADDIAVSADLTKLGPGTHTVPLRGVLSANHQGVVTDIQPSEITVELARRFEQLVSIDVIRTAEPPPGLTSNYSLSEKEARIVGPETRVKQVVGAQARISLQDQRTGFSKTVPVIPIDANNKEVLGVTVAPAEVTITIDIQPRPDVTELSVVARLTGELPSGYLRRNYTWEPKTVGVRGDRSTIESMNGLIPTEPIDLTGKTQTFTQGVKLALPPGVTLVEPVDISVTVEIEPILGSREFDNIPVLPQGLDTADFTITIQPDRVNVIVNGPQPVLDTLTASDISVIAPLSGYSAGKNPVTLQASVARPEIKSSDIVIPNARAEVIIVARNPTTTPTIGPSRTPTPVPTPTPTATPAAG